MGERIAIHESQDSDKVVEFISLSEFTEEFQKAYNNNLVWGCFYQEGEIVSQDTDGDIFEGILN